MCRQNAEPMLILPADKVAQACAAASRDWDEQAARKAVREKVRLETISARRGMTVGHFWWKRPATEEEIIASVDAYEEWGQAWEWRAHGQADSLVGRMNETIRLGSAASREAAGAKAMVPVRLWNFIQDMK